MPWLTSLGGLVIGEWSKVKIMMIIYFFKVEKMKQKQDWKKKKAWEAASNAKIIPK